MPNVPIVNAGYKNIQGLNMVFGSGSTITIQAGQVRDSTDTNDIMLLSDTVVSTAFQGVNGLDIGTVQTNKVYAVYVIGDSTKYEPGATLLSESATNPSLPFGYDMFRRVGYIKTDGSFNLLNFEQRGNGHDRILWYNGLQLLLNGANNTVFTDVGGTLFVPPAKTTLYLVMDFTPGIAGDTVNLRAKGSTNAIGSSRFSGEVVGVKKSGEVSVPTNESGIFQYKVTDASDSVTIYLKGYVDNLY